MIVWLNGPFGAGKTTTSAELAGRLGARVFDPEYVGYLLRVPFPEPIDDFQHLRLWRPLVVETAARIHEHTGGPLVIPQTILVAAYAREIFDGLAARGLPVAHFVLHAGPAELRRRIETDQRTPDARQWRLDHLDAYAEALPWLRRDATIVDTEGREPAEIAEEIAGKALPPKHFTPPAP
ncbi:AAA family ATPase [Amycolatopsis sp. PS_44_ISF1]|uniref:AAA family ATPase n=1 Tax=Amycolatopsis sp. PS_44_ISF1 TaxID=2974917 RepID=UPI0028DDD962|nr:AAA family ATPase [Amycolatopsis sp. PS_44_ISF1]MDT8914069.1 AAA family ATPase [Amycolatopsis sp. PS_44_ISF1]